MAQSQSQSDFIDLKGIFKNYLSKWYLFVISVVVMGLLGLFYIKIKPTKYQVNANVILSTKDQPSAMTAAMGMLGDFGSIFGANADIEDEIFIITSYSVLKDVAKDLDLNITHNVKTGFLQRVLKYDDYPVQVYPQVGMVDTLRTTIAFKLKVKDGKRANLEVKAKKKVIAKLKDAELPITLDTEYGQFIINKTSHYPEGEDVKTDVIVRGFGTTAEDLAEDITVDMASKRSNIIEIGYQTPYPEFGEKIINKVIELYNMRGIDMKKEQFGRTATFLSDRVALVEGQLNDAESQLLNYMKKNGIVNFEADAEYNYTFRGENETKLIGAETRVEVLKTTLDFLSDPKNAYSLMPILSEGGEALSDAITTYNNLIFRRMEMLDKAKGDNYSLKLLDEKIDAMRASIRQSVEKYYSNAQVSLREIRKTIQATNQKINAMPDQRRDMISLYRARDVKQQLYLYLLKSQEETALSMSNTEPNAQIIDEAYTKTKPLGMSNKVLLLIFLIVGMCIPPIYLYVKGFFTSNKTQQA